MSDRRVLVESMVRYSVIIEIPEFHYSHTFSQEGRGTRIPFDALEEGIQEEGIRSLFTSSTLSIPSKKDRIDLGLEVPMEEITEETNIEEVEVEEEIFTISTAEIIKLLKLNDPKKLEDTLKKCGNDLIDNFIKSAIQYKAYSGETIDILQKYASDNTDINKLIALARAAEKPEVE